MPLFGRNIISNQVIKSKTDHLQKRSLKDAKNKIKKGVLIDSHDLSLYLKTIDARYSFVVADINHASRIYNYAKVRAEQLAEARQLLDFFTQDYSELDRLYQIVDMKAKEAGGTSLMPQASLTPIDLTKLKNRFEALTKEGENNV